MTVVAAGEVAAFTDFPFVVGYDPDGSGGDATYTTRGDPHH